MTELAQLLCDNAVLIHNLLRQDAKRLTEDAAKCKESGAALLDYAKFREELAANIVRLKPF